MKTVKTYIILLLVLTSCYVDDESSFISDPFDPRMPQYSEEGANTAGAYINNYPWVARKRIISSIFSSRPNAVGTMSIFDSLATNGTFMAFQGGDIFINESAVNCSVGLFLGGINLSSQDDLFQLEGNVIELDGDVSFGQLIFDNNFDSINYDQVGVGTLYIRRVERVDSHVELSGTFGFSIISDEEHSVFSGRFDYKVYPEQFRD